MCSWMHLLSHSKVYWCSYGSRTLSDGCVCELFQLVTPLFHVWLSALILSASHKRVVHMCLGVNSFVIARHFPLIAGLMFISLERHEDETIDIDVCISLVRKIIFLLLTLLQRLDILTVSYQVTCRVLDHSIGKQWIDLLDTWKEWNVKVLYI